MSRIFFKNKIIIIFSSLFVASVFASDNPKLTINNSLLLPKVHYKPRIEWGLKTGNKRDMSRLGAVIPIYETGSGLWFSNIYGLWDSSGAVEGNFGLGYRYLIQDEWIVGGYGFYDRRKISYHNRFQQLTLGIEALRENLELRINGYVPIGNKERLIQIQKTLRVINPIPILEQNTQKEKALYGFDVEGGGNLPNFKPLEGYLAYYQFFNTGIKPVWGVRLRGQLNLNPYLSLEGEISRDRLRKTAYFVGFKLQANFAKRKMPGLRTKMTQMAIRDIDIVTDTNIGQKLESISVKLLEENNAYMEVPEEERVLYNPESDLRKLGLKLDASKQEIKKAANRFRLRHHPDKTGADYELYHKAQFLEFQDAYERLIHWKEERDAGREVWIKKSQSDFHSAAESFTPDNSQSQALVPYQKPKFIPQVQRAMSTSETIRPSIQAPIEISHFTGSGRKAIDKIVLYSSRHIALIPKGNSKTKIPIAGYDIYGIPKELPTYHLQSFADNSFWQVRVLSDGSFKVQASVKGVGGVLPAVIVIGEVVISNGVRIIVAEMFKRASVLALTALGTAAVVETAKQFSTFEDSLNNDTSREVTGWLNRWVSPWDFREENTAKTLTITRVASSGIDSWNAYSSTNYHYSPINVFSTSPSLSGVDYWKRYDIEKYQGEYKESIQAASQALKKQMEGYSGIHGEIKRKLDSLRTQLNSSHIHSQHQLGFSQRDIQSGVENWIRDLKQLPGISLDFWRLGWEMSLEGPLKEQMRAAVQSQWGSTVQSVTWKAQLTREGLQSMENLQVRHQREVEQLLRNHAEKVTSNIHEVQKSASNKLDEAKRQFEREMQSFQQSFEYTTRLAYNNYDSSVRMAQSSYDLALSSLKYQSHLSENERASRLIDMERTRAQSVRWVQQSLEFQLVQARNQWLNGVDRTIYSYRSQVDSALTQQENSIHSAWSQAKGDWSRELTWLKMRQEQNWRHLKSELEETSRKLARQMYIESLPVATHARHNDLEAVKYSLQNLKRPVDAVDELNNTALSWFAFYGNEEGVRYALSKGADVNRIGNEQKTPLQWAALEGHAGIVRILANAGANLEYEDSQTGLTALLWTIERHKPSSCGVLLECGAQVNHRHKSQGYLPITWAAYRGATEVMPLLKAYGADVNKPESSGTILAHGVTPLITAASMGYNDTVEWLLANGADLFLKDNAGRNALEFARTTQKMETAELLEREHSRLSVLEAVRSGDTEKALTLADSHDIHQKDHLGRTGMSWAAVNGQLPVLQKLASKGGHVSESDVSGFTPLIQASASGHKEVVNWLLDNGADKNQKDRMERDALWWSLYKDKTDITKLLLDRGFNPNQVYVNDYHNTPLTFAAANGGSLSLIHLLNHGADINYQKPIEKGRYSPLMYTASYKNLPGMETLLWHGADTNLTDSNGWTARDWAVEKGFSEGVRLLDGFYTFKEQIEHHIQYNTLTQTTLTELLLPIAGNMSPRLTAFMAMELGKKILVPLGLGLWSYMLNFTNAVTPDEFIGEVTRVKDEAERTRSSSNVSGMSGHTAMPGPPDENDRNKWKVDRYDRVMRHERFGKFYRDPKDGKWWTKDRAGHGGSSWKVFEESEKGLKWVMDVDEFGDIINKHKGEVGRIIPWKELVG